MQEKVGLVRDWLSAQFGGAPVAHQHVDMLQKFRVETTPKRWLYVSDEFLGDLPEADLLDALRGFDVFYKLTAQSTSTHVLLTHTGAIQVGVDFGRGASD